MFIKFTVLIEVMLASWKGVLCRQILIMICNQSVRNKKEVFILLFVFKGFYFSFSLFLHVFNFIP
ncbi:hypothetical protein B4935_02990 [Vibrio cholerae]|nr:hypothetical protein [Vibrio cholerae]MCD1232114.1 hypothetical protein [Vibrio cholerae]MCD1239414.1 hypothetical protein [Vibrio cholerae]MCD1246684.1 hypothetical protein [Vibrio cholerae]